MTRGVEDGGVRCANGGECVDGLGDSYTCICQPGWDGDRCEVNIDECEDDPCLNEGHCMDLVGDFIWYQNEPSGGFDHNCLCLSKGLGYFGADCDCSYQTGLTSNTNYHNYQIIIKIN